ncbi:putative uncharacterized protein DDB_G0282129 [Polistes fuscatus]|uniref:putative uncharacterized protein DDB_G0282129 n=1 Tax=Polistes fuscatus TaxID=30207 RepID=UPI001CA8231B|nr:putative uncharacterized protein DDB_G0282129 [Polistes fuscatus]
MPRHIQEQQQQQQQQMQELYMEELSNKLSKLRIDPLLRISSENQGYHNDVFVMTYSQENENDNNYNEYHLPPIFPFRYERPMCSRSLSITDVTYDSGNNNSNSSSSNSNKTDNNNAIVATNNYDENDYDDVEDESPRKGLLKQIFCLPLN